MKDNPYEEYLELRQQIGELCDNKNRELVQTVLSELLTTIFLECGNDKDEFLDIMGICWDIRERCDMSIKMKDQFELYLSEEEAEKAGLWAFGEEYKEYSKAIEFMKAWNERHSDLFTLTPDGSISNDIREIVHEYLKLERKNG